jgi:transposase-like protein
MSSPKAKKTHLRQRKIYSEEFRKKIVLDIEKGRCSVLMASREYDIPHQTIYNWLYRYSRYLHKNKVLVVEEKSEQYRRKELEQRIKDLEAALGRKQMEIDLLNKLIEVANQEYRTDLKKNISKMSSNGSGSPKGSNTNTQ